MLSLSTSLSNNQVTGNTHTHLKPVEQNINSFEQSNADFQQRLNQIAEQIQKRQNNVGYATGAGLRNAWDSYAVEKKPKRALHLEQSVSKFEAEKTSNLISTPFADVYKKIFPQNTLRVAYVELDPGVDDGAALLQLLAATESDNIQIAKKVQIVGIVPCVGNAILPQTEINTRQFLELTKKQNIPVYPGAISPLAIENDPKAILEMEKDINDTHFYGHDGEEDVGGWPNVTVPMQKTQGYKFIANSVAQASPETALTFVSTSAVTELAKAIDEIQLLEQQNGVVAGTYAKNINAISIMGGCIDPATVKCNAPFNATHKNSEANFYFDSPAAQKVFAYCQKFEVPIILSPLDLTQQPGLMWTKAENNFLRQMNNSVSKQMARVTEVIPYIDAKRFPNGTYPMHDLFAALGILRPDFFNVTKVAASIGDVGQIIIDPNAPEKSKNVYILSVPVEKQPLLYRSVLKEYGNFNCSVDNRCGNDRRIGFYIGMAFLAFTITIVAAGVFQCIFGKESSAEVNPLMAGSIQNSIV